MNTQEQRGTAARRHPPLLIGQLVDSERALVTQSARPALNRNFRDPCLRGVLVAPSLSQSTEQKACWGFWPYF